MKKALLGQRVGSRTLDGYCRILVIGLLIDIFSFQPGTTIGRRHSGTMVIDAEGNPASFGLMLIRSILKGMFAPISIILVLLENDAVHDMILKTKTVQAFDYTDKIT